MENWGLSIRIKIWQTHIIEFRILKYESRLKLQFSMEFLSVKEVWGSVNECAQKHTYPGIDSIDMLPCFGTEAQ